MADDKPIIVIKKKGGHGGHHGGAWKVAYADFVTAMMAFFMVMWLVNSADTATRQSIASYFRRPGLFQEGSGTPLMIGEAGILQDAYVPPHPSDSKTSKGKGLEVETLKSGTDVDESDKRITLRGEQGDDGLLEDDDARKGYEKELQELSPEDTSVEQKYLEEVAEEIREQIQATPELQELLGIVDVEIESDGLNIEIMDTKKTSMFGLGSPRISPEAQAAFSKLATILGKLDNKIDIVGHTDAKPFSSRKGGYSNWELSADRANAARRLLEIEGIPPERITSVVGRADKDLRDEADPLAPSNRRITLKMRFDMNKNIDLSKDPKALDSIDAFTGKPTQTPVSETAPKPKEKVHSFTPKEILNSSKKKKKETEKLPTTPPAAPVRRENPKDLIFGDSPVMGPRDPFSTF